MHRIDITVLDESPEIITGHIKVVARKYFELVGEMMFERKSGSIGYKPINGWDYLPELPESTWKQISSHLDAYVQGKEGKADIMFWNDEKREVNK